MHRLQLTTLTALTVAFILFSFSATALAHPHDTEDMPTLEGPSAQLVEQRYETLKAKRERLLEVLKTYRARGVFPDNSELSKPLAVFIDRNGVPCAFANLMIQDGHGATVRRIARTHNNLLVSNVTHGPIYDWILSSGFTRAEAAQIQVPGFMYRKPPPIHPIRPEPSQPDPSIVKRIRIQESLAKTIQSLEASTHNALLHATARSFPKHRLSARNVSGLLSQAIFSRTRNTPDGDKVWVDGIVARALGNDVAVPKSAQPTKPSTPSKLSKKELRERVNKSLSKRPNTPLNRDAVNAIIAQRLAR